MKKIAFSDIKHTYRAHPSIEENNTAWYDVIYDSVGRNNFPRKDFLFNFVRIPYKSLL